MSPLCGRAGAGATKSLTPTAVSYLQLEQVRAALDRLPARYKAEIEARHREGLRLADIAAARGVTAQAVRLRLRKAVSRMRRLAAG
jgi:DNA-directed RNA polymerase specialized sigma24 family protein